jgi:preprotein translocase subunit SecD
VVAEKTASKLDCWINPSGAKRARIRSLGDGRIEIAVYGDDPEEVRRIERLVETAGTLEFRFRTHLEAEIATRMEEDGEDGERLEILVVKDRFDFNGSYLVDARPSVDEAGRPNVLFELDSHGGRRMGALTSQNLPDEGAQFSRNLGVILNGSLYSAPAIRSTIFQHGQITGDFTRSEVEDLVDILNRGRLLPVGFKRVEPHRTEEARSRPFSEGTKR